MVFGATDGQSVIPRCDEMDLVYDTTFFSSQGIRCENGMWVAYSPQEEERGPAETFEFCVGGKFFVHFG